MTQDAKESQEGDDERRSLRRMDDGWGPKVIEDEEDDAKRFVPRMFPL